MVIQSGLAVSTVRPHGYTVRPHGYTVRPHGYTVRPHGYTVRPHGYTVRPHGYTVRPYSQVVYRVSNKNVPSDKMFAPNLEINEIRFRHIDPDVHDVQQRYQEIYEL